MFVDGVYVEVGDGRVEFREASAPDEEIVFEVGRRVFTRLERFLKREGYLDPTEGVEPEALDRWWMRATQERPVLPTRPRLVPPSDSELPGGFSIHAGVRIEGDDREGREQLLRYASRPAFSEVQLSLLEDDIVELELKSPTASGQRVVHLHPVQFLRRLAWLIPPPKQNQVRYCGVFGPTHRAPVAGGGQARVAMRPSAFLATSSKPRSIDGFTNELLLAAASTGCCSENGHRYAGGSLPTSGTPTEIHKHT